MTVLLALLLAAAPSARAELRAADVAFSRTCERRDPAAFAALVAKDAAFGGPRGFRRGRAAVLEGWKPLLSAGGPALRWQPERAEASAAGDLGFTTGRATFEEADGARHETRYVTVWRRDRDGRFRALFDLSLGPAIEGRREVLQTARSGDGKLVADVAIVRGAAGPAMSLRVRRRTAEGWRTAIETAVALRPPVG